MDERPYHSLCLSVTLIPYSKLNKKVYIYTTSCYFEKQNFGSLTNFLNYFDFYTNLSAKQYVQ